MEFGLYILKNSIVTSFLRDSPREIHRKIYAQSVLAHGGFYLGAVTSHPDVLNKIQFGDNLALLSDDLLTAYKHLFTVVEEEVNSGPAGYHFQINLPIMEEIVDALMHFRDSGILQKVKFCYIA